MTFSLTLQEIFLLFESDSRCMTRDHVYDAVNFYFGKPFVGLGFSFVYVCVCVCARACMLASD
jgi:hypothetical protein